MVAITIPERITPADEQTPALHFSLSVQFELEKEGFYWSILDHIDDPDEFGIEDREDFVNADLDTIVRMIRAACVNGWHPVYAIPDVEDGDTFKLTSFHCTESEEELPSPSSYTAEAGI